MCIDVVVRVCNLFGIYVFWCIDYLFELCKCVVFVVFLRDGFCDIEVDYFGVGIFVCSF